jgi:dipeptidyl aminopeptidase/acylaminoacyl peptidase
VPEPPSSLPVDLELTAPGADRQGPLTPDDLLRLEELGEVALSPDGRWLAYVVKRPRATARFHKYDFLGGGDRGDVWLVDTSGGEPHNLTAGAGDGSGYWAPSWSPDSERLAMRSTKGGNVQLWGCDIRSRTVVRLCDRPLDVDSRGAPSLWVSHRALMVATLPEGERPLRMAVEVQAAESAMRAWPKAWKGQEATGSVLDSGSHPPFDERRQGELRLVDALSGDEATVMRGFFSELRMSPDGRHVAFLRQDDVIRPEAGRKLERMAAERHRLGVVRADGEIVTRGVEEIEDPDGTSLRWSPDSAEIALIGRDGSSPASWRRVLRYRCADGRVVAVTDAGLEPTSLVWTADGAILALAKPAGPTAQAGGGRADWWLVGADREARKLTADLVEVPVQLFPEDGRHAFVGLADGEVWRLCMEDGRWTNLTADGQPRIASLVWPSPTVSDAQSFPQLVLAVEEEEATVWYSLDLPSGALRRLARPSTSSELLDFAPERDTAVLAAVDRTGARLWTSKPAFEEHMSVLETNTWLSEIAEGEVRRIDYRGLDGNDLKGWLVLPVDYEPGTRCPLVTEVYPGLVFARDTPPRRILSLPGHHAHNVQLLSARGYAVLLPSMPLKPYGEPSDPYFELTKGVLPAVDKVIELGIADPDRLGVMGQSYGGYGTYGLITQTHRFKAAVALAGLADLASLYGQFDARFRYGEYPHESLFRMALAESGQTRMGGPPWKDAARYLRNSPLSYAERAETPVLIIQGDMDYVPLQQGEQFFGALYRQGRRARFVRYWGEGHVFQSPANIRDMWEQIYAWFDEFL